MTKVTAPWDAATVDALNAFQRLGHFHPFTCPNPHDGNRDLLATESGWICELCGYTQSWAIQMAVDVGRRAP